MTDPDPLVILDAVISSPCPVPLGEMAGDERDLYCGRCRRPVLDLAGMKAADLSRLLEGEGDLPCVLLYRSPEGRIITADGPIGPRAAIWRRLRRHALWAASLFAIFFLQGCRSASYGAPARQVRPTPGSSTPHDQPKAPETAELSDGQDAA